MRHNWRVSMKAFVANTDQEWWAGLRRLGSRFEEVCFWRPTPDVGFRAVRPGEPFLFKLKAPRSEIAGFGFFSYATSLPCSAMWRLFGEWTGAESESDAVERLHRMRTRVGLDMGERVDYRLGCILVREVTLFEDALLLDAPGDFEKHVGLGKVYSLKKEPGRSIWRDCLWRTRQPGDHSLLRDAEDVSTSLEARPRLGPLSFAASVLDAYGRRCAVTGEGTLAALQPVRIRASADWSVPNGILLRADLARLFDAGLATVTPDYRFVVSESVTSRVYRDFSGSSLTLPDSAGQQPLVEALWWHGETRFRGRGEGRVE
jgi:putative restriction endonuclease